MISEQPVVARHLGSIHTPQVPGNYCLLCILKEHQPLKIKAGLPLGVDRLSYEYGAVCYEIVLPWVVIKRTTSTRMPAGLVKLISFV